MTIAAGLMCSDGILLCADTEHTDYVAKYQKEKIFQFQNQLVLAGAGSSDFIRMTFDKLCDEFRSSQPANPSEARDVIETLVLDIHSRHIFQFYQPNDQSRPSLDLVIGARCSNGDLALVKTLDSTASLAPFYEAVGNGRALFEYWASLLYRPDLTIDLVSYIALFILREVKRTVQGCGGFSFTTSLAKDPAHERQWSLADENGLFAGFPQSIAPLLTYCRDLRKDDKEFHEAVDRFAAGLRMIRQMEWQKHNMNKIMAENLPLPDAPLGVPDPFSKGRTKEPPDSVQSDAQGQRIQR